jgi:hypothetical protein
MGNLYHENNISEIEILTVVNTKNTEFVCMTPWSRFENYLGFSKWEMGCILENSLIDVKVTDIKMNSELEENTACGIYILRY